MYKNLEIKLHLENKTNWLLGISAGIVALLLPQLMLRDNRYYYAEVVLFVAAVVSFLLCLLLLDLPHFFIKSRHEQNIMFYKDIARMSREELREKISNILTEKDLIDIYVCEIQNLARRTLVVKTKLLKIPTYILFFATLISFVLVCIS